MYVTFLLPPGIKGLILKNKSARSYLTLVVSVLIRLDRQANCLAIVMFWNKTSDCFLWQLFIKNDMCYMRMERIGCCVRKRRNWVCLRNSSWQIIATEMCQSIKSSAIHTFNDIVRDFFIN